MPDGRAMLAGLWSVGEARVPELPTGTVTFLFTDLETSTRLWEDKPDAMGVALARHDEILRAAIASHRGVVYSEMGDGVAAVFASAPDAVAAALETQRALIEVDWGEIGQLRARMGLHSDEGRFRAPGQYVNRPLNRCARLMAVAHGGQVVVSDSVERLVRDSLPPGGRLVDLGEHRLRDLARPMHVFQLAHPAVPTEFPPLRSLDAFPGNLPFERTTLVGRTRERAKVAELLEQRRLVTLTGVGGVGKTRLATHVAAETLEHFPDGAWLVPLATIREPELVPSSVAGVLGIPEQAGRDATAVLIDAIGTRNLLLILDNCEHLLDSSARLADALLDGCINLRVLATSREALGVEGEQSWPTPSLGMPETADASFDDVAGAQAVELFVDRARSSRPDFVLTPEIAPDVATLCTRLDGIPLAIELAAARVSTLTPRDILDRIDQRFLLLTGGSRTALERHQTLQAAVAWSYDLLDERERRFFDRLSVFAGGFTVASAHAVAADPGAAEIETVDTLSSLVHKSMVLADGGGASARFRMLETLRQYGRDRLSETEDVRTVRDRHARYFLELCETLQPGPRDHEHSGLVLAEADNFRAAFDWFAERGDAARSLECITLMGTQFLEASEGFRRSERALRLASQVPPGERALPFSISAFLALTAGDHEQARNLADESIVCAREAGIPEPAPAHLVRGLVAFWNNDSARAVRELESAVECAVAADDGSPRRGLSIAQSLNGLGFVLSQIGETDRAIAIGEQAMMAAQAIGSSLLLHATRWMLAMAYQSTDRARAAELLDLCIRDEFMWTSSRRVWELLAYAQVQLGLQDAGAALSTLCECLAMARTLGDRAIVPPALTAMARAQRRLDRPEVAARLLGASHGQGAQLTVSGGPADIRARERLSAQLRETLGAKRFEAEYEAGRALSRDDALLYATEPAPAR